MQKNIKQIMIALDQVLNTTVWVNQDRQIISLSDELHIGHNNAPRSIEDLPRASLVGAYVSLQIRTDNFDVAAETLETHDLALKVKEMVFSEAKKIMDAFGLNDEAVGKEMMGNELKEIAGFGEDSEEKNFNGVLTDLQMQRIFMQINDLE